MAHKDVLPHKSRVLSGEFLVPTTNRPNNPKNGKVRHCAAGLAKAMIENGES